MKYTNFLIASIAISINTQAEVIHTSHFVEYGVDLPDSLKKAPIQSSSQLATTSASANAASGNHGQNISATGNTSYNVSNNSSSSESFYVDRYMCIQGTNCTHSHDSYTVGPHENATGAATLTAYAYMPNPWTHEDESSIQVSGSENSSARGTNRVIIN